MSLCRLVESVYREFDMEEAMEHLRVLTTWDRFQASKGIEAAAEYVAEAARRAGLVDVEILRFAADGERHWWTFRSAWAWTPLVARLELLGRGAEPELIVDHQHQPHSIAVHSCATPEEGLVARLVEFSPEANLEGAVVVLGERGPHALAKLMARAEHERAVGIIVDANSREGKDPTRVQRVELAPRSKLFAFSVSANSLETFRKAARAGASVRSVINVDCTASVPVVWGRIPGRGSEELLLLSHLCHARPGANDNASGNATLLGLAKVLGTLLRGERPRHGIRFMWGPEFVGLAAVLHKLRSQGSQLPLLAINLDMVGEDQVKCGGPLILERAPEHVPSFLDALLERCVELLPAEGHSYSGAITTAQWTWRSTPFVGASDHLLLADRSIARPAAQIGHWPDRFNHSSTDTLDKVDAHEVRRAATLVGASSLFVARAEQEDVAYLERVVALWGMRRMQEVLSTGLKAREARPGTIDPFSEREIHGLLMRTGAVALNALQACSAMLLGQSSPVLPFLPRWMQEQIQSQAKLLPRYGQSGEESKTERGSLRRCWEGPFNLRALIEESSREDGTWIREEMAREGGRAYAAMVALALAVDDRSSRTVVMRSAACTSRLVIEVEAAERFLDILKRAGWITEE